VLGNCNQFLLHYACFVCMCPVSECVNDCCLTPSEQFFFYKHSCVVKYELLTLPEHLISPPCFVWFVLLNIVFCVLFYRPLFSVYLFSFTILLSVLLRCAASGYRFVVFRLKNSLQYKEEKLLTWS
jgi:hypothetical protein